MEENTVVVIRFKGMFEVDGEGNWRGNEEDDILKMKVRKIMHGLSAINFHDRVEEPTIDDYNRLHNIHELDVEYNNDTYGEWHEYENEDIRLDEDITVYNEAGGNDNQLNATSSVHVRNIDIPFVSMVSSPIAHILNDNRGMHYPVHNESESQPSEAQFYQS
ncbi:hypothetical protein FNV43_RR15492 [Rhamnella rubrinervis]|uniref:Uncharacterized protein n=1 Tax=Rhamnella rubrinervis TaxID=2594499 RepID=A0A8K0E6M9_9ROSA|nr:hypothetical protein FNV43_RR15492 [Rhamnella rubrinervis]